MRLGIRNNLYRKMFDCFMDKCDCIILLYKNEDTYEVYNADEVFESRIKGTKGIAQLFDSIFLSLYEANVPEYRVNGLFDYKEILNADNQSGHVEISVTGGTALYDYRVIGITEEVSAIYFIKSANKELFDLTSTENGLIRGNYLFSMMIDLGKDKCINPHITENGSGEQSYFHYSYSDWRAYISEMFYPEDKLTFLEKSSPDYLFRHLSENEEITFEIQMLNMSGQYIWVQIRFKAVNDFSPNKPYVLYTVRDINDLMLRLLDQDRIIEKIQLVNEQLKDENRQKSSFVASMSHEIRTPLNAILGMNELIMRDTNSQQTLEYARDIRNAGRVLTNVINDILDYSQLEAGMMKIVPVEYNVSGLIRDCCSMTQIQAGDKGLDFVLNYESSIPSVLLGDDIRIRQVIVNLLSNSVKYTREGSVTLTVDFEKETDDTGKLKVSVEDTGIGIKQEDIEKLTQDFVRLDLTKNHYVQGTGLGMSIVSRLLTAMGSKIEIESVYGEGSKISFELEQRIIRDGESSADLNLLAKSEGKEASVLVVDDITTNLTIISSFLKGSKYTVTTVDSGEKCIDVVQKMDFDIVLLDHLMPQMDGIETLEKIRQLGGKYMDIPFVVLTANASSDIEMYKSKGFCDYLPKPVVRDRLIRCIEKNLR